jgi:integrative and conjugative element protein (TIGR02256 family)
MPMTDSINGRQQALVAREALHTAVEAGSAASPKETGGILLGFRIPDGLVVTRFLLVEDTGSSTHSYLRRRRPAQLQLDAVRRHAGPAVGYVGDWHTHPKNVGPSRSDARSIAAACRDAGGPVALIVLSYAGSELAHTHAQMARRTHPGHPLIRSVDLNIADMDLLEATAESLEHEATTYLTEKDPKA